ncbi:glycosyltransferase [Enteractinococcus coprophilus]|uniref:D-inositol 3-phosphate glycosyltransferase n=1 Tax=Enteractinococcus coprophilus TaxID=1027633 RepID=A0A543AIM0_9MICC|nr:glycosyltransferase [Enteractinococcus coprophilus]TQL72420.1 glycosyltransferase involved in cell wall biosynthesis [Enteractinococcus coprophilus]
MAIQGWQRQYLGALLQSQALRAGRFESVQFFSSIADEPADGIQELLLHRLVAGLESIPDAINLLDTIRHTSWKKYGPRILARIGDTEAVLKSRPDLAEHFQILRERTGYTTYSIKDWKLVSDGTNLRRPDAPVWTSRTTPIQELVEHAQNDELRVQDISAVLQHFFAADVRIFQLAIMTFADEHNEWARILHQVLAAPYLEISLEPHAPDHFVSAAPAALWAPHWRIVAEPQTVNKWDITEVHTGQELQGLGSTGIYDQISVLLAVSGLLREGINLCPLDKGLVRALTPSQPIWGFRRREFSAARTTYQADDVRGLALAFLEKLPATQRVSMFRSRLAIRLVGESWIHRNSASVLSKNDSFYQHLVRTAQLFGENRFEEVIEYIEEIPYGFEPAFQFFYGEAQAALALTDRVAHLPSTVGTIQVSYPDEILCVSHASVPDQTGGYAIRAHGILKSLRNAGVEITAVTRPGFPTGVLTERSTVTIDEVDYQRLPATDVTRNHGEIRYMMSFIEPFKALFKKRGIGIIHVRSTFLIALPALIAARELGLKILYEVSGLWELVYQDREQASHLLKRSPFAELAETLTMTKVDQLVVMNEAVRQIAIDRGVDASKIQVVPNAVNVDSFSPLPPPHNEVFTIGYLGSFQDYEGLEDIIEAVKILRVRGTQVRVRMVGDGLQYNAVRSRIKADGLDEVFELTGRVPHEAVIDQYKMMDVLVYPRRSTGATETITPLKPFEALALAKPIIVSDVAPLAEIAGDNERGLVFRNGDIEGFARAIQRLVDEPELRVSLGQHGRDWVVVHRNWGIVAETFVESYQNLASS